MSDTMIMEEAEDLSALDGFFTAALEFTNINDRIKYQTTYCDDAH